MQDNLLDLDTSVSRCFSHLLEISPFEKAYGALTEIWEVRTKLSHSCCIPVLGSVPTNVSTGLVGESSVDLAFLGTSTTLSTQLPLNGSVCFVRGEDSDSCFTGGRKGRGRLEEPQDRHRCDRLDTCYKFGGVSSPVRKMYDVL